MDTVEQWYLRSYTDGDTHYGKAAMDGTVTARCALTFAPLRQLLGDGPVVVPAPVNPWQACPRCRAAGESTDDSDGATVRGVVQRLEGEGR